MSKAHRIGTLLFCADCGTLLDSKDNVSNLSCEQCGKQVDSSEGYKVTTRSAPDAFRSALWQKRKIQTKTHEGEAFLTVAEICPECGHSEAYSRELQMRSADEGTTILYTCVSCRHGWRVNN